MLLCFFLTWWVCYWYDGIRKAESKTFWHHLLDDANKLLHYLTGFITFILGFFNSVVYSRWWELRCLCGRLMSATLDQAAHVTTYYTNAKGDPSTLRKKRRKLIRSLGLSQALIFQACHRVRDHSWLIENDLMDEGSPEHQALKTIAMNQGGPGYNEACCWFMKVCV
jgi:predicted membrane chloride channel (bestrophin family)